MHPEDMSRKTKKKRTRRQFSDEYKAEVARLCQQPETGLRPNLRPSAVADWVKQAAVDAGGGGSGALTTTEREEVAALRKENRQLRQEREILKRATASYAKEGTS